MAQWNCLLVGLADVIVDLVSTGGTLRANHLKAVEEVGEVSSRLVVNQASFKLNRAENSANDGCIYTGDCKTQRISKN